MGKLANDLTSGSSGTYNAGMSQGTTGAGTLLGQGTVDSLAAPSVSGDYSSAAGGSIGGVDLVTSRLLALYSADNVFLLPLSGRWTPEASGALAWVGIALWMAPVCLLGLYRILVRCFDLCGLTTHDTR